MLPLQESLDSEKLILVRRTKKSGPESRRTSNNKPMDLASSMITLGVQTSREDDRTDKPILELRRLLASECEGPYSPEIREFALILRVGGEMQEFDFET